MTLIRSATAGNVPTRTASTLPSRFFGSFWRSQDAVALHLELPGDQLVSDGPDLRADLLLQAGARARRQRQRDRRAVAVAQRERLPAAHQLADERCGAANVEDPVRRHRKARA